MGFFGLGKIKEIKLGKTFAVVITETKPVSLIESDDNSGIYMRVELMDVSTNTCEEVETIEVEIPIEISMVDVCTSEASLYFTNEQSVKVELKREEDLIDCADYDFVVTGREVTFR